MESVPMEKWGKDHFSLLGYLDCRCTDDKGTINGAHLRHNPAKRPAVVGSDTDHISAMCAGVGWKPEYGTRLAGFWKESGATDPSQQLPDHDDIDCLEDLEAAGVIKNIGSGLNPLIRFTEFGHAVANRLREHKRDGGNFAEFAKIWAVISESGDLDALKKDALIPA
jgi:hypothetical protein